MIEARLPAHARLISRSRSLSRGAVGDAVDGRSRQGRFLRQVERELFDELGGAPSFAQAVLVRRVARAMFELEAIEAAMGAGNAAGAPSAAMQTFLALNDQVRLGLRDLGLNRREET